ncbi:MAG: molybdopterin molybdotransferase MoeA [Methylococcales bacterium]|nr:molybdopterin molybdotransferase MoeA [Methylococcales bacterium]
MTDACSIESKGLISIELALKKIKQTISPIQEKERVTLKNALGRILSDTPFSPINIPFDHNSAMDGYAFASIDIKPQQKFSLSLVGTSWAGKPYVGQLKKNECIRIFTGAVIPAGVDSVIMQEQIKKQGEIISFPANTMAKQNIRLAGSDIKKGTELLSAPKKISAIDLGLLASAGIYDISVKRKLNIAFLSTGDELCSIGQSLKSGQIFDSNRYALSGLLSDHNINVYDLGVVADDKTLLEKTLLAASKSYDVIITTGGASVGDADYIKEILDHCGNVGFWKIAIKPGKPLAFGKIKNCYFFGLPGNPVSVIATFHKIVVPALQYLSGLAIKKPFKLKAVCMSTLKKGKGREEYQRGVLSQNESGEFFVESAGGQGSNIMSAMSKANCYIVLPVASKGVRKGETVTVEPFEVQL